ncbi:glycosyltransferase family 4 protein [Methylophaga sp.]|jgi:glycosyltransferase involved in cell wall biosynthesis|uniref:glycosyltransferase family 4 protein n=1 Tax=Methylophaga sp. TaxID=2024840 RepID=UPI0025E94ECF|nr:glycosyltransferase family 4 protein [Methylophaga sp.]
MNLAYLTTEYPAVSHTFIRREIVELEKRGHTIQRFSIRQSSKCIDEQDIIEQQKTIYLLSDNKLKMLLTTFFLILKSPFRSFNTLKKLFLFSRRSERGHIRHIAYFVEACVLLKYLFENNLKHIHVHFGTNATAVAYATRLLSGKKITYSFTIHGPDEFDAPIGLSLKEKALEASFVVAISNYCASQVKRWIPVSSWPKVQVIGCTVDSYFMGDESVDHSDTKTFICVGRLSAQKGHFILLDALEILINKGIECQLVLAGDGELRGEIEAYIAKKNLNKYVTITGWVTGNEVRSLILSARAMVLPSFAEGLPVVIMEAFILNRPVITTHIAGIPELVKNGENGWLVTPNDSKQLADVMSNTLSMTTDELLEMGKCGYSAVKLKHLVSTEIPKLERALAAIIN